MIVRYSSMFLKRLRKTGFLFLICVSSATLISAQAKQKAKAAAAPTFEITSPNHVYPQTIASMLEFDAKNADLVLFDGAGKPDKTVRLQNGVFENRPKDGGFTSVRFADYQYFEYFKEQPNHALASISWSKVDSSSSSSSATSVGLLQVFEVRDGHAVVTQQIRYNRLGDGVGSTFNPSTLALTLRGIHGWERGGTTVDVGKFRWDGKKFVLQPSAARR